MKTSIYTTAAAVLLIASTNATKFFNSGYGGYKGAIDAGANDRAMIYRKTGQMIQETPQMRFNEWLSRQNKHYSSNREYMERMYNWLVVDDLITHQNWLADQSGDPDFLMLAHNFFSDMTDEEKALLLLGRAIDDAQSSTNTDIHSDVQDLIFDEEEQTWIEATSVDWIAKGTVHPTKNQGNCGSCYAFGANTVLEAYISATEGTAPLHLSEQHVVDCSWDYNNGGCGGGLELNVWAFNMDYGAIAETDYPYEAANMECRQENKPRAAIVTDFWQGNGGPIEMINQLQVSAISVGVQANNSAFFAYSSGIMTADECSGNYIDHGVILTGYQSNGATGTADSPSGGSPYFTIQNSWGADWGQNGTAKLAVDWQGRGPCGVNAEPFYVRGESVNQ